MAVMIVLAVQTEAQIGRWMDELRSEDLHTRESAAQALIDAGEDVVSSVRRALSDPDPDLAASANRIMTERTLRRMDYRAYPSTAWRGSWPWYPSPSRVQREVAGLESYLRSLTDDSFERDSIQVEYDRDRRELLVRAMGWALNEFERTGGVHTDEHVLQWRTRQIEHQRMLRVEFESIRNEARQ